MIYTSGPSSTGMSRRNRVDLLAGLVAGVACALAGLAFILVAPLPGSSAEARTVGRGIIDYRLEQSVVDLKAVPDMVAEMGQTKLRSRWTRILVHWATMQPVAPGTSYAADNNKDGYADAYVEQLDAIVAQLHAAGISIVMTPLDTPKWASDSSLWNSPPPRYDRNVYYPFYAPDMDNVMVQEQFKALGTFLAGRYAEDGKVKYFECWNEPNQGRYLYPQTPASAKNGGARTYLTMLKAWYAGVKQGSRDAVVIAGATAPRGKGDRVSTPPQAFARYLKNNGALRYMDAYSHHPYTPGGFTRIAPGQLPNSPDRAVTLGNLSQLTKLFPKKPFYLTEFGYNTQYCRWFGVTVSRADQARYLRQAYSVTASRYPQVKALLWFVVDDWNPSGRSVDKAGEGVYMGVRTYLGQRKPGWYAFAGGNSLTLKAPASARRGVAFAVSGKLTSRTPETPQSEVLTLQARKPSSSKWSKVASVHTALDGSYSRTIKQSTTKIYRMVWGGVVESATRRVRTP